MKTNCWKLIDRARQNGDSTACKWKWEESRHCIKCVCVGEIVETKGSTNGKTTHLRACIGVVGGKRTYTLSLSPILHQRHLVCLRFYANSLEHEIVRCGECWMEWWEVRVRRWSEHDEIHTSICFIFRLVSSKVVGSARWQYLMALQNKKGELQTHTRT